MKKLVTLAVAALVCSLSIGQTADEIVQKHIQAIGGADAWKKVNSVYMEGAMNVMGRDVEVKITQLHQKGSRQDISVAGINNYTISTPTYGYNYWPVQGQTKPEPMTPEDVKEGIDDLDLQGNLIDYQAKGHAIEYLGTEDIDGTECHKLKVVRKNSGEQTIFIDPASYYIVRSVSKRKSNGQEMELKSDLSDYRDVNGLKIPHSIAQAFGTIVFKTVKLNEPVDEKLFAEPAK
jgi:outer membrane lipoprotein-sorting protein